MCSQSNQKLEHHSTYLFEIDKICFEDAFQAMRELKSSQNIISSSPEYLARVIYLFCNTMAFSELLLASRVMDREYVAKIGNMTHGKCISYFVDNKKHYFDVKTTYDEVQFIMEQAFDKSVKSVAPIVRELVFGNQEIGQMQIVSGIMTICFPDQTVEQAMSSLKK